MRLSQQQRQSLARAITAAHHEITGAPAFFAQVLFHRLDPACHFIGGDPARDDALFIEGRIRDGRGPETIRALIERLIDEAATVAGVPKSAIWVYIQDMPFEQMAEYGRILPRAGEEQAWVEQLRGGSGT